MHTNSIIKSILFFVSMLLFVSCDKEYSAVGDTLDLFNPSVDVVAYNRTTKKNNPVSNTIPDELDYIKEKRWLINDVSLTFYIDQSLMADVTEPSKIVLYDINNQQIFSVVDASGRGLKYKVGITDYVRNLVNDDYTNVKLGVSVAQAVSNIKFKKTKDAPPYALWQQLKQVEKKRLFFSGILCYKSTRNYSLWEWCGCSG